MPEPIHPAARPVAANVAAHFARHLARARAAGVEGLAPAPDAPAVERLLDVAFWASLRREEGYTPRISLALLPDDCVGRPLRFEHPLPFAPAALTRLAAAVERPGVHLGVWPDASGELRVWGATRTIPALCLVLEVVAPGLVVVKRRREEGVAKFANVIVVEGDQVKVVDEHPPSREQLALLAPLLSDSAGDPAVDPVNVLAQLAVSMRAHGRGGTLLVVPVDGDGWGESIVRPLSYPVVPSSSEMGTLLCMAPDARGGLEWRDALRRAVDTVAGLTAVDGATVLDAGYRVLAFGAKLRRREGCAQVERVVMTEPIVGSTPIVADPTQLGGTRHLSAAQFAHDQRDTLALVASQDGRFTVFRWSDAEGAVHAHRIEALLL